MAVRACLPQAARDVPKLAAVNERSDAHRGRQLVDLPLLNLPPHLQPVAGLIAVLLVGALLGAAGFAATVHRRQIRRIARLTERLAMGAERAELTVGRQRPGRASFEQLRRGSSRPGPSRRRTT
jgi:hypothetical protein